MEIVVSAVTNLIDLITTEAEPTARRNKWKKLAFLINNIYVLITGLVWILLGFLLLLLNILDESHGATVIVVGLLYIIFSIGGFFTNSVNSEVVYYIYSGVLITFIGFEMQSAIAISPYNVYAGIGFFALAGIKIIGVVCGFHLANAVVHRLILLNRAQLPSQHPFAYDVNK
nr:hypothetical transcript [Hymenolepis microstoma]